VRLTLTPPRGLSVRPRTRTFSRVRRGRAVTATVTLRRTRAIAPGATLTATARTGRRLLASSRTVLVAPRPRTAPATPPAPGAPAAPPVAPAVPPNPLVGKAFWRNEYSAFYVWDNRGLVFLDDTWAYRGLPKGGRPTCTTETARVDEDGDEVDGCLRYAFDPATRAFTAGSITGRVTPEGTLTTKGGEGEDDDVWTPLVSVAPGTRLATGSLIHRGFSGTCGPFSSCTTWRYDLELRPDGTYVNSRANTFTADTPTSFIGAGNERSQNGTYEVLPGDRLRMTAQDGTVTETFFALLTEDGRTDPAAIGVMLDDTNYYREDD
jgi:hypothetical protein